MNITQFYLYSFFSMLCLSLSFSAHTNVALPSYCPQSESQTQSSKDLYSCFKDEVVSFNVDELAGQIKDMNEKSLDQIGENLEHRLSSVAVKKVLQKKQEYLGLFEGSKSKRSEDLIKCGETHINYRKDERGFFDRLSSPHVYNPDLGSAILKDKAMSSVSVNKENQRDFLALNLINGIKAAALFNKNKHYYKDVDTANNEHTLSILSCSQMIPGCNEEIVRNPKSSCLVEYRACAKSAHTLKDQRLAQYNAQIAPLYSMVSQSPLLFDNANEGEVLSSIRSDELGPSRYLNTIKSMIPNSMIRRVQFLMDSGNESGLKDYLSSQAPLLNGILDNEEKYQQLSNVAKKEISNEQDRLNLAALKLCEGEGENLHHNRELVEEAFREMNKNATDKEFLKHQFTASRAGYCQLLKTKPLGGEQSSIALIGGFALLGIGGALQLIPVAGNAAGVGLIATGLSLTGGAVLTGVGIYETAESHSKLNSDIGMHSIGYSGYQEVVNSKDLRDSNLYWSALDTVLIPVDLHALRAMKRSKDSVHSSEVLTNERRRGARRHDFEQRKAIEEIEQNLGEDFTRIINQINPQNKYKLSKRDEVYFAGIAKMIEEDLLHQNPKLRKNSKRMKVKLRAEMDDIVKDCAGEKK